MLPAPYMSGDNATMIIPSHFNDKNKEDPTLYFDITKCHFLLDLDTDKETDLEPIYAHKKGQVETEKSNKYFRAFYIPFFSDKYVVYGNFSLLQSTKLKIK
ncbi:hypothetical protein NQ317_002318 [Molorchus minor]|uniref:Uncharacterized protein n=1 Tax=Molorchus minor TaxID=1323400 RepID=A0ABQ9J4X5_9CUCU|nr:hypothetical protein NQ317_002318 [Molorchus minor]